MKIYTKDPDKFIHIFNRSDIKKIVLDNDATVIDIKFKRKYGKFTRKVIKFKTK